jgi:transcriptional regulator with XRE-family HTH domain
VAARERLAGQDMSDAAGDAGTSQAGDLAHRLTAARNALHLSVEEVAKRAEVQPNYLHYLETSTALASSASLRRIAAVLETSEEALLGATPDA